MLTQIVALLLGAAADLLAAVLLARVWMQWARAPFRNPVGRFVVALTDWAVLPLRRIVPGLFGIDLASVLAAWLAQIVYFGVMAGLFGLAVLSPNTMLTVAWAAGLAVFRSLAHVLIIIIVVVALISWINPHAPLAGLFQALARPVLSPIQRIVPPLGGIDLSPLVALLLLQAALIVLAGSQPAMMPPP